MTVDSLAAAFSQFGDRLKLFGHSLELPSLVPQPTCCWKFCFSKSDGDPVYISPRVDYFKCISEDVQNCGGGDREIFERRSKVLDSYQDLRVHHTSLPPDLHPFQ